MFVFRPRGSFDRADGRAPVPAPEKQSPRGWFSVLNVLVLCSAFASPALLSTAAQRWLHVPVLEVHVCHLDRDPGEPEIPQKGQQPNRHVLVSFGSKGIAPLVSVLNQRSREDGKSADPTSNSERRSRRFWAWSWKRQRLLLGKPQSSRRRFEAGVWLGGSGTQLVIATV